MSIRRAIEIVELDSGVTIVTDIAESVEVDEFTSLTSALAWLEACYG